MTAGIINVQDHGATGNPSGDDTAAILEAISRCRFGSILFFPAGTYNITETLRFPPCIKVLGGNQNQGSKIQALTTGMVMATVDSSTVLEDLFFEGYNKAAVGILPQPMTNKTSMARVRVHNCTKWGFAFDSSQNGVFLDCFAQYNGINYAILNGSANLMFINCNGNLADQGPDARNVLIAHITDDPMLGPVHFEGNRNIDFYGRIFERGYPDYQIEVLSLTGYLSLQATDLNGARIASLHVGPDAPDCRVLIEHAQFTLNGGPDIAGVIESGEVRLGDISYSGKGRRHEDDLWQAKTGAVVTTKTSSQTTGKELIPPRDSSFRSGIGPSWSLQGHGAATEWDTTGRARVTGDVGGGVKLWWNEGRAIPSLRSRFVRFVFNLQKVRAGSGVAFHAEATDGRRRIGVYGNGEHSVLVEMTGTEGGFSFLSLAKGGTFELCYVSALVR